MAAELDRSPSIVARSTGPFGVVAAHFAGGRVEGIRCTSDGRWDVHVVMSTASTVSLVEADVLAAAQRVGLVGPVDVTIDDIANPPAALPAPHPAAVAVAASGLP